MLFSAVGRSFLFVSWATSDSLQLLLLLENPFLKTHNNIKNHRQVGIYVYHYGRPFICLYNVYVCNSVFLYCV